MNEPFELPVIYNGNEALFPAELVQVGYTHRFVVDVYGQEVFFEPDEERNYRAVVQDSQLSKRVTADLLKAIAATIEALVK